MKSINYSPSYTVTASSSHYVAPAYALTAAVDALATLGKAHDAARGGAGTDSEAIEAAIALAHAALTYAIELGGPRHGLAEMAETLNDISLRS